MDYCREPNQYEHRTGFCWNLCLEGTSHGRKCCGSRGHSPQRKTRESCSKPAKVPRERDCDERRQGVSKGQAFYEHDIPRAHTTLLQARSRPSETTWFHSARAGEQLWGEQASWNRKTGQGRPYLSYSFATHVAEVEVDTETGKIDVVRYVACHDAGRVINRILAEGQVHGGVAYGLGYALMEETLHEKGKVLNPNLLDYYIPTSLDVPDQIVPILVEHPASTGPFGAKGLGEPPAEIVAPAVANAVFNAVGVRIRHLPITSEKVYFALKGGRT